MRTVIVTDLTRFSKKENVCTAVIDLSTGECIRPMPYFKGDVCEKLNLQPGAILKGNLTIKKDASNPHIEDANYSKLTFEGPSTSEQFKTVLNNSLSPSVSDGFGVNFSDGQKHIPIDEVANCSIITINVSPGDISIHEDQYKPGKIKVTVTDQAGHQFRYLAITDLGFYDYAMKHQNDGKLQEIQNFVSSQQEIFLRIGLSREFQVPDGKNGYWLQVNGIYTFPDYQHDIRSYT